MGNISLVQVLGLSESARMLAAAAIGISVVAIQRRARQERPLGSSMEQTYVLLCLAGALMMLTVVTRCHVGSASRAPPPSSGSERPWTMRATRRCFSSSWRSAWLPASAWPPWPSWEWRDRVDYYIDLKQLVTHVAIEAFLAEEDGVLGGSGMANFYLYRRPVSDRHRLIVWDKDRTFAAIDRSIVQGIEENGLLRRALSFDDLRGLYLDVFERCAQLAAAGGWLENQIVGTAALVDQAAHEDARKPFTNDALDAAVEFLKQLARQRPAFVLQSTARERQAQ